MPTIKYYVREGLLPAGQLSSPNQAGYDDAHERRPRLIRALLDVGGLKVAAIAEVLAAIDDPGRSCTRCWARPRTPIVPRYADSEPDAEPEGAREEVRELIARRGRRVDDGTPAVEALAAAPAALDRVGHRARSLHRRAGRLRVRGGTGGAGGPRVCRARRAGLGDLVESAVIGTVLG
ncbi:MerR family transcriptional regulator [Streptomyces sp. NPDC002926]